MTYLKFFPALVFLIFWVHVIDSQTSLKATMQEPLYSEAFILGMGTAIDDPWSHTTALSIYFQKLQREDANAFVWSSSGMFADAYWTIFQNPGSLAIKLKVAEASDQPRRIEHYAKLFNRVYGQ